MKSFLWGITLIFIFSLSALKLDAQDNWQELANYIETSVENNNPYFINKAFNYPAFCKNFFINKSSFNTFNEGFISGLENSLDPGNIVINKFSSSSTYDFISDQLINNDHILIFRLDGPNGIDYHEYTLKLINNEWFITNIYFYYDATSLQTIVNQYYQINTHAFFRDSFSKNNTKEFKAEQKLASKLVNLYSKGRYNSVINIWQKQPNAIQNKDQILHIALRALSYENPNAVDYYFNNTTIDTRKKNQLAFTVIDGLYKKQQFKLSFKYIDKLDTAVGGDPYLDLFRASTYKAMDNIEQSAWCFEELIDNFPNDQSGYISLLELYLENKQFLNATNLLNKITTQFGIYKTDLLSILEEYPSFTNSKEYANWISE